jgi:hypothetical protein
MITVVLMVMVVIGGWMELDGLDEEVMESIGPF